MTLESDADSAPHSPFPLISSPDLEAGDLSPLSPSDDIQQYRDTVLLYLFPLCQLIYQVIVKITQDGTNVTLLIL